MRQCYTLNMIIILKIGLGFYSLVYSILKLFPTRDKIVFLSRQSDEPSRDFQMIERKINELHPDYITVMLTKKIDGGISRKIGYCLHMLRQCWHLATSKAVILDSYSIMTSCLKHKKSLLVIQIWHSVGTMKQFGYSTLDKPEGSSSKVARAMKMHRNYDYIFASSEAYKPHLAAGFDADPSIIKTLALPRVELLKSKEYGEKKRAEISAKYPDLDNGRKNIVYCPTFRREENEKEEFKIKVNELIGALGSGEYNLILKLHPLSDIDQDAFSTSPFIIYDTYFTTFDMLFKADIVISDYSCVIYEAALLDAPLFFYAYDYDEYTSKCGLYIDYKKEMPGPICSDANELAKAIAAPYDMDRLKHFCDKYVSPENHDETESIVKFIFDHLKEK